MTRPPQTPAPVVPKAAPRRKHWSPARGDVVIVLLTLNLLGLVALAARVLHGDRPTVVTVGITQMAREYTARLATANIRPEEARIRTQLFLAVAQDAVRQAAGQKGVLVMPRECILAGEYADITGEVSRAVATTLDRKGGDLGAAAPTTGGALVQP